MYLGASVRKGTSGLIPKEILPHSPFLLRGTWQVHSWADARKEGSQKQAVGPVN